MAKHLIIRIDNQGVHYNNSGWIPWKDTNLPSGKFRLKEHYPIFWEAEMTRFDPVTGLLYLQVIDYEEPDTAPFDRQRPKKEVKGLVFATLRWYELEAHLSYYEPQYFDDLVDRTPPPRTGQLFPPEEEPEMIPEEEELAPFVPPPRSTPPITLSVQFSAPLMKTTFDLGYIRVEKKIPEVDAVVAFKIYNEVILPEFDHIKSFFTRIIGRKRIAVKGEITLKDGKITQVAATSPEIAAISEETITNVKALHTRQLLKPPKMVVVDKSLFTANDIFEESGEPDLGNTFRLSDRELLEQLLDLKTVRNRRQLEYLSGKLHDPREPLRFTLNPVFGFLFFIEGETMHHFVWELLDSHATYLWSMEKGDRSAQYQRIQRLINFIRLHGREEYKRNAQDDELTFHVVRHDKAGSAVVDGFPLWRHRLNEKLV